MCQAMIHPDLDSSKSLFLIPNSVSQGLDLFLLQLCWLEILVLAKVTFCPGLQEMNSIWNQSPLLESNLQRAAYK